MIRILCFGDSNTWGYIPGSCDERYDENTRYTKVLQKLLGEKYEVIEEGLRSRTACCEDFDHLVDRNGSKQFPISLYTHDRIDYVVLMIGSNDMKDKYNMSVEELIKKIQELYIDILYGDFGKLLTLIPKLIIVAPGIIKDCVFNGFKKAHNKSLNFNKAFRELARKNNCLFVNNNKLIAGRDGVHLTAQSHKKLANSIYKLIISL